MSNKTINLATLFNSSSLITRQTAQEVFNIISESPEEMIILDFSQIKFASRSFFDELNNLKSKISLLGKQVKFMNLNKHIEKLLQLVVNAEKSKSSFSYSSIANAEMITI
jgi:anti-anti-sigma regulatory factor